MIPTAPRAGDVLAGRYEVLEPEASGLLPGNAARAIDQALGVEVTLALWGIAPNEWPGIAERLITIGELRHPTIIPLVDFARLKDEGRVIAVTPIRRGEPLAAALGRGSASCEQALAVIIAAAAAFAARGLPTAALEPTLWHVTDGTIVLSALDLAAAPATDPGIDRLAAALLEWGAPSAGLRRRLQTWSRAPPSAPAPALAQLRRLLGPQLSPWPAVVLVPLATALETPFRDLAEAGQGGSIVIAGEAPDAVDRLRLRVRAEGIPLVELAAGPPAEVLSSLLRQLARFASPAFRWRHGDPGQSAADRSVRSATGSPDALVATALGLITEVAAARPLVIRWMSVGRASAETIDVVRRLTAESLGHGARACLYLIELGREPVTSTPHLSALLQVLEATPGYRMYTAERPPGQSTPSRRERPETARKIAEPTREAAVATPPSAPESAVTAALAPVAADLAAGRLDRAESELKAARSRATAGGESTLLVEFDVMAIRIALARGDWGRARRHQRAALSRAGAADRADVLAAGGELAVATGAIAEAATLLARARRLGAQTGRPPDPQIDLALAAAELEAGHIGPAAELATAARAQVDADRSPLADAVARAIVAIAAATTSKPGRARLADPTTSPTEVRDVIAIAQARIAILHGVAATAVDPLRAALRRVQRRGHSPLEATIRAYLADALTMAGSRSAGRDQARAALAIANRSTTASAVAQRALAAATDDRRAAERHLQQSLALLDGVGATLEAGITRSRIGDFVATHPDSQLSARLRADVEPPTAAVAPLATGSRPIDERSLQLLASALRRDDSPQDLLAHLAEAARSPWGLFVPSAGRFGLDPSGNRRLIHGSPPAGLVEALTAALDHATADSAFAAPDPSMRWLLLPARRGLLPAGALALAPLAGGAPVAILAALAAPLVREQSPQVVAAGASGDHGLVGQTEPMLRLFAMLERIADNELPVLLQGESGTGKELVAQALHARSPRRAAPFVPIDCAAIPESLIESELFGHRRGAFTGTVRDRKGLFEEANGGTVFLDEAANIPLGVQAKLLRVLQEREVRRVGDTVQRPIDVRLIAASNQPLEVAVREGRFREDLFFRLNVIEITLPPLRARLDDLPLLAASILARLGDPPPAIDEAALETLAAYDWPGNVRELENELRRAHAVGRGTVIRRADLSRRVRAGVAVVTPGTVPPLREAVAQLERDLIVRAFEATGWHRGQTAALLGLSHQGLLNKIRKYQIRAAGKKNTQPS